MTSIERCPNRPRPAESGVEPDELLLSPESDVKPVLSVVMPTLNEEEGVAECVERIKAAVRELEIPAEVIVSDSSTDRTPEIAREHGAIVVHPDEKGYGYAYRYAFERARGDYIAIGDADTTYDFEELPKLFEALLEEDADMVLGSRFAGEIKPGAMPALHRYVGNPVLTAYLNVFYDANVSDAHSGLRIIERDALEELELRSNGMEFASEMVMAASERGHDIVEVPITYHERAGEAKLESFRDGWRHVRFMTLNAPGYVFSVPALLLGVSGIAMLALSFIDVSIGGIEFGRVTASLGGLHLILGYQILSLAAFAALASNPIRDVRDPITKWILDNFSLEYGLLLGTILFVVGNAIILGLLLNWAFRGMAAPQGRVGIAALTGVIVGVQTMFFSFFLSIIDRRS